MRQSAPIAARGDFAVCLRARNAELCEAIYSRAREGEREGSDAGCAEHAAGLRAAIAATVSYSLAGIERAERADDPVPEAVTAHARHAARDGARLDAVMRRFNAIRTVLDDALVEEAERVGLGGLRQALRVHGELFEQLIGAVAEAYADEARRTVQSRRHVEAERVRRLLAGASVDPTGLDYALDAWHSGVVASGADAEPTLRRLASVLGRTLLIVRRGDDSVWAWLGGQRPLPAQELQRSLEQADQHLSFAIGEPALDVDGFRLTHGQARSAQWVAMRSGRAITRYADVLLLSSALQDDLLARSLHTIYLAPLDDRRDGDLILRDVLRAYFSAGHNVKAAAASLGVDRATVRRRLRTIEQRLGRPLHTCQPELDLALRLERYAVSAN